MAKYLLALNCGSSSLKTTLFAYPSLEQLCTVSASSINSSEATLKSTYKGNKTSKSVQGESHSEIFSDVLEELKRLDGGKLVKDVGQIKIVTHRIVHGGTLDAPVRVSKDNTQDLQKMEQVSSLEHAHANPLLWITHLILDCHPLYVQCSDHVPSPTTLQLSAFAPLHNHHAVLTVKSVLEKLPNAVNFCCFDTLVR